MEEITGRRINEDADSNLQIFSKSLQSEVSTVLEKHVQLLAQDFELLKKQNFIRDLQSNEKSYSKNNLKLIKRNELLTRRDFNPRPSLLTDLLMMNHIQSIYNIFVAILFLLFLSKATEEVIHTGSMNLDLSLITWNFGKFDRVIMIWLYMMASTSILVYLCFHHWAHSRHLAPRVYDVSGGVLFFTYLMLFLHLPARGIINHNLPPTSSIVVLCEQVRMFMKTWAFVRSNITRVLEMAKNERKNSSNKQSLCPDFSQYLFFLFAPTLLYRDKYPRNKTCNWMKVAKEFGQVLGCLLYTHFVFVRFCIPIFQKFGCKEFTRDDLMIGIFSSCFPGSLVLLCGFFCVLHSWMNAFAEMMKFADRMFYKDWWNSTSYPRFYRTWNCIVHDWLYEYVYLEVNAFMPVFGKFAIYLQFIPMLIVFFISSIVHEYIIAMALRFFYPVLLVLFGGFGVLFMFVNTKAKQFNIFLWVSLILGNGILMCLYSIEYYARINCSPTTDGALDYIIPRSWVCYGGEEHI